MLKDLWNSPTAAWTWPGIRRGNPEKQAQSDVLTWKRQLRLSDTKQKMAV